MRIFYNWLTRSIQFSNSKIGELEWGDTLAFAFHLKIEEKASKDNIKQ